MTDEKREAMSEEVYAELRRLSEGAETFRLQEGLTWALDEIDHLRTELENARAQAAADRAFQVENSRLRDENKELLEQLDFFVEGLTIMRDGLSELTENKP